jgi:predicted O-methyltransferase YrrM
MPATQVNIVVDVKQKLSRQSGDELVSELGGLQGVSRAWVSPRAPRLVLVDYDPKQTDTQRILGTVVRRGFDARLVGM